MNVITLNKGIITSYESFIENSNNIFYFFDFALDVCPEWSSVCIWCNNQLGYIPDAAMNPETLSITVKFDKFQDYLLFKMNYEDIC